MHKPLESHLGLVAAQEAVSSSSPPQPSSGRPSSAGGGGGGGSGGSSWRTTASSQEEAAAGAGGGSPQAEATIRPQRDGVKVAALRSMSEMRISKFNRLLEEQVGAAGGSVTAVCLHAHGVGARWARFAAAWPAGSCLPQLSTLHHRLPGTELRH